MTRKTACPAPVITDKYECTNCGMIVFHVGGTWVHEDAGSKYCDLARPRPDVEPEQIQHKVLQMDGWPNTPPGDCIVVPDEDGDAITGSSNTTYTSRSMGADRVHVRAHVLNGANPATAARLLRKMADWVDRGPTP